RAAEALAATGTTKASIAATIAAINPARMENRREADASFPRGNLATRRECLTTFRENIGFSRPEPG
ncbi:MAG TPA: hypothetical protein VGI44_07870, partial [Acidimicrobiales bacterium]